MTPFQVCHPVPMCRNHADKNVTGSLLREDSILKMVKTDAAPFPPLGQGVRLLQNKQARSVFVARELS